MSQRLRVAGEADLRAWTLDGDRIAVSIDTALFPVPVVTRAVYTLMDRGWFFIQPFTDGLVVIVRARGGAAALPGIVDELGNALIDAKVRADIAAATLGVHEMIVAEAFAAVRGRPA